tara:strand:- start:95 stop:478 length:384 start_codon:yes stop_codon:yes gene_type:complete
MRYRKNRRFRHRSNGRSHHSRVNGGNESRLGSITFSNDRIRNNTITPQSAEKLVEKYNLLAKEALSSGDKHLSENYYQHADHFARILHEKVLNQKQNSSQNEELKVAEANTSENIFVKPNQITEEKK